MLRTHVSRARGKDRSPRRSGLRTPLPKCRRLCCKRRRTTSTLKPNTSCAHHLPLPSYPASSHRCESRGTSVRAYFSKSPRPSWSGTLALCTLALLGLTLRCPPRDGASYRGSSSCPYRSPSAHRPLQLSLRTGNQRCLRSGMDVPTQADPHALEQRRVQPLPCPVDAPPPKPAVDGLPRCSKSRGNNRQGQPLLTM